MRTNLHHHFRLSFSTIMMDRGHFIQEKPMHEHRNGREMTIKYVVMRRQMCQFLCFASKGPPKAPPGAPFAPPQNQQGAEIDAFDPPRSPLRFGFCLNGYSESCSKRWENDVLNERMTCLLSLERAHVRDPDFRSRGLINVNDPWTSSFPHVFLNNHDGSRPFHP